MDHFLSLQDCTREDLQHILALSSEVKRHPERFRTVLDGRNIALLFMKPSTRTRISFEVGINQLGGKPLVLSASELQLGRGETLADTARVLSRYVDALMARVFEHQTLVELARHSSIPIINGLSDLTHPCQGICDYFTLMEKWGTDFPHIKLAYLGDGNNVAHSLMLGAASLGVHLSLGTPPGYEPSPRILEAARQQAAQTGAEIEVTTDPYAAVRDAHAVYTDVWASMGQEKEAQERHQRFEPYRVTLDLFNHARSDALFMHCLPAHRSHEVTDEVADHERSVIFDQAENRLHTQKALLCYLFGL